MYMYLAHAQWVWLILLLVTAALLVFNSKGKGASTPDYDWSTVASADLASMIVIDKATVRETDLIIIDTATSVEFDSTHQGGCGCGLLNFE